MTSSRKQRLGQEGGGRRKGAGGEGRGGGGRRRGGAREGRGAGGKGRRREGAEVGWGKYENPHQSHWESIGTPEQPKELSNLTQNREGRGEGGRAGFSAYCSKQMNSSEVISHGGRGETMALVLPEDS